MAFDNPSPLGRTGLKVGPLGWAAAYGAPARALEAAFDAGCNYFYWGALRRRGMADAVRNLAARGLRDRLVVCVQVFARTPALAAASLRGALRRLGGDYVDVLLLGMYEPTWGERVLEGLEPLRRAGAFRHLGASHHRRSVLAELAADPRFGVLHVRYSAAHPGAERDVFPHLKADGRPGVVVFNATAKTRLLRRKYVPADLRLPTAADCYRFALSHPAVDCVTAAPANDRELTENLNALRLGPMSDEEGAWMRRAGEAVYRRRGKFDVREAQKALAALAARVLEGN